MVGGNPPLVASSIIGSTDLRREEPNPVIVSGRCASESLPDAAIPANPETIKRNPSVIDLDNPPGYFPLQPMR